MTPSAPTIRLGGEDHTPAPPSSFALREDVARHWIGSGKSAAKSSRTFGLALGLCVPDLAKRAKVDYRALDCDGDAFGEAVYNHLREAGVTRAEIATAATGCYYLCLVTLSPRKEEVKAAEDFTGPREAPPT